MRDLLSDRYACMLEDGSGFAMIHPLGDVIISLGLRYDACRKTKEGAEKLLAAIYEGQLSEFNRHMRHIQRASYGLKTIQAEILMAAERNSRRYIIVKVQVTPV